MKSKTAVNLLSLGIIAGSLVALISICVIFVRYINRARGPNVILVVTDALRPDHLGCYGYQRDTSNNIDLFANDSMLFTNAIAQAPATLISVWNILISKYQPNASLTNDYNAIPEYFKSKGYKTAAFISQKLLDEQKIYFKRGFDVFDSKSPPKRYKIPSRVAESITNSSIQWLEKNKQRPFFILMWYFDTHDPYDAPDGFRGYYNKIPYRDRDRDPIKEHKMGGYIKSDISEEKKRILINAYDEEVRYVDCEFGRFLDYLKESGRYNNSIIIFISDHGEELGDNNNRWDHCQLLSQEEIHVPLIIKMPWQEKKKVITAAVQIVDIYPTLIEYFDKEKPPSYYVKLEGKSLIPLINGRPLSDDDRYAASFWEPQRCIIKGNYKYWFLSRRDHLIDIKNNKEIDDSKLKRELKTELNKIYNKYILNKNIYGDLVKKLKSIGYMH